MTHAPYAHRRDEPLAPLAARLCRASTVAATDHSRGVHRGSAWSRRGAEGGPTTSAPAVPRMKAAGYGQSSCQTPHGLGFSQGARGPATRPDSHRVWMAGPHPDETARGRRRPEGWWNQGDVRQCRQPRTRRRDDPWGRWRTSESQRRPLLKIDHRGELLTVGTDNRIGRHIHQFVRTETLDHPRTSEGLPPRNGPLGTSVRSGLTPDVRSPPRGPYGGARRARRPSRPGGQAGAPSPGTPG